MHTRCRLVRMKCVFPTQVYLKLVISESLQETTSYTTFELVSSICQCQNFYQQTGCQYFFHKFLNCSTTLMALEETGTKKRKRKHNNSKKHDDIADPATTFPSEEFDKSSLPHEKRKKTHGKKEVQGHTPTKSGDEHEEWNGLDEADSNPTTTSKTTEDALTKDPAADETTQIDDS